MTDPSSSIDRKRMADGTIKPAGALHVATKEAAEFSPPPSGGTFAVPLPAPATADSPKIKPFFRPAKDDTKPTLRDPVRRFLNSYLPSCEFFLISKGGMGCKVFLGC